MRIRKLILASTMLLMLCASVSAKVRCLPIYAFGVSASFTDSLVYFTDIQIIDSAWIDDKSLFLLNRSSYSNQLRSYFAGRGEGTRTCIFSFATSEKKIMKKYDRMRRKFTYKKKKERSNFDVRDLSSSDFKFTIVRPDIEESQFDVDQKANKKAEKARKKQSKKSSKNHKVETTPIETESGENLPSLPPRS